MVTEKMFNSIEEIQRLQELACSTDEDVTLHSVSYTHLDVYKRQVLGK